MLELQKLLKHMLQTQNKGKSMHFCLTAATATTRAKSNTHTKTATADITTPTVTVVPDIHNRIAAMLSRDPNHIQD